MHTGIISFCDRIGFNIKSSDVKDAILNELESKYNLRILQKHWYRLDAASVSHLDRSPHYACLRSNGNPYFMFFTRYEDTNIIYFVDKKVQPGYEKPRIILGKGRFADHIFDGTILDGEMVKDFNGGWMFLINDMLALAGRTLYNQILPNRIQMVYAMFDKSFIPDDMFDVCLFQVKKYFPCAPSELDDLLAFSQALPYTNRGLYFWPQSLKYKPKLYNFNDALIKSVIRKVKDNPEFKEIKEMKKLDDLVLITPASPHPNSIPAHMLPPPPSPLPPPPPFPPSMPARSLPPTSDSEKILQLRKTENPDVYDIFDGSSKNLGIAHVATLKTSKMLRAVFKDMTVAVSTAFVCKYKNECGKWEPLRPLM